MGPKQRISLTDADFERMEKRLARRYRWRPWRRRFAALVRLAFYAAGLGVVVAALLVAPLSTLCVFVGVVLLLLVGWAFTDGAR